ncbi:hypothetical protein [Marinifilum caeruleilacunae]|uniref:PH domain-containing protein n=1 Tax=Marinifilum caeruleilacunae TaxID=2499076 RepID=A0ABX1X0P2_9BACT|nr:hypothetical protein [Marinifilum caeruleilacunae]NOU61669.1 hypothetical protein [Marinifilum caeruleilacunae]
MTINNQNRASWIKLFYYLVTFSYLASIVLLLYLNINKPFITIGIISVVFFTVIIFSLHLNFNYIIYKEGDDKVILRYYPLHPFHDNFKSIEIPKNALAKFEIEKKTFGLKPNLTLFQITDRGVAKYPAVCLSALSKSEKEKIIASLSRSSVEK